MRTGEAFQTFGEIRKVVLDKTGTLTEGRPAVRDVAPATCVSVDDLLALAAAAESASQHPFARAIVDAARTRGLAVADAEYFNSVTCFGVEATFGGRHLLVGRGPLLDAPALTRTDTNADRKS